MAITPSPQKEDHESSKDNEGFSRRKFFKYSLASSVGVGAAVMGADKLIPKANTSAVAAPKMGKTHDTIPMEIIKDYQRMNQKNTIFCRFGWDPKLIPLGKEFGGKFHGMIPPTGEPGWTEVESALSLAAWSVDHDAATNSEFGIPNQGLYAWEGRINERKTVFDTTRQATEKVKRAAHFLGTDLVGICDYDERWVYSDFFNPFTGKATPGEFPFKPKSVVVLALEMDYDAFRAAPSLIASAAAGNIYSNMAAVAHKVATFIRQLGYRAIPCGNDSAMSIPLAVSAGLGELGRNGVLITEKYGPRVRLCKVFTDLELTADKPITFGVQQFCEVCLKCADQCPGKAISHDRKASFKVTNISNNPGVKKWCLDSEKCFAFWAENGGDCGSCIASCPYNKIDDWHHSLTKAATLTPAKPVLRYFDELFGYGKTYNEKAIGSWWKIGT
jgi:reductive dehalogenase